jgi:integrase
VDLSLRLGRQAEEMGLGSYTGELEKVHEAWNKWHNVRKSGRNPLTVRAEEEAKALAAEPNKPTTFITYAKDYVERRAAAKFKNPKSRQLWDRMIAHTEPFFGRIDITLVTRPIIWSALIPIWEKKPVDARKMRGCIDLIFEEMCSAGLRPDNPTPRMPAQNHIVKHFGSLHELKVPAFMSELRDVPGIAARAFEFLILTATRTHETLEAKWGDMDTEAGVWKADPTVRNKMRFACPLVGRALEIIKALPRGGDDDLVFPSPKTGRVMNDRLLSDCWKTPNSKAGTAIG